MLKMRVQASSNLNGTKIKTALVWVASTGEGGVKVAMIPGSLWQDIARHARVDTVDKFSGEILFRIQWSSLTDRELDLLIEELHSARQSNQIVGLTSEHTQAYVTLCREIEKGVIPF